MKRMVLLILLLGGALHAQETRLRPGDLLFYADTEGMGAAVKESTGQYTHVAMVVEVGDSVWIVDATQRYGVSRRPFLRRPESSVKPYPDVYRLTVPFDTAAVLARANALVGKPYDDAFLPNNDAYYCSELIQVVFNGTQASRLQFESQPMNWRDKEGRLPEYWQKHFEALGMPVPEGIPGTNPTDLSRSPLLRKL